MDIAKALDLASSTAAYLLPKVVEGAIRDWTAKQPVIYNAIRKVPWATNTYYIRKKLSLPSASWSTDGGPLPAATDSGYGEAMKSMKYLYTRGEVTGPMQAAAGSLFNALTLSIEDHQKALVNRLSADVVQGTGGQNDIEGIRQQIINDAPLAPAEAYTGGSNKVTIFEASGAITLAMLDEALDQTNDANTMIVSRRVRRKISSLLQAQQMFVNETEVAAGFRVQTYNGYPILTDPDWTTNTEILFFNRDEARLLVHKDFTYEELAKTKDSVDYMIKGYFGFALEGGATLIRGFTAP